MSNRLKRILFAVFFVLFSIGVALLIWFVFFRAAVTPPTGVGPGTVPTGSLPGAGPAEPGGTGTIPTGPGGLPSAGGVPLPGGVLAGAAPQTVLLRDSVTQQVSPSADKQGARYYDPADGRFYRITTDGISAALSEQTFPNVEHVEWGNASDQAILEFPDGTKLHYDFRTQTQTTLPKHWEEFDFAPDDRQMVAKSIALDPDSRYLIVTDPTGNNPRAVENLGQNDKKTFPVWTPSSQIVAYAEVGEANGFDRQSIILVGQNRENFRALQVEGRGFLPLWSPAGTKVLYSAWTSASEYRPDLWVSGGDPDNVNKDRIKLNIQTWADKCVWASESTIYCAVPDTLPTGAGLQRSLFATIPDTFYKIDLQSGAQTLLGKPEGATGAQNLMVTADERNLLFTDTVTGRFYDFKIP